MEGSAMTPHNNPTGSSQDATRRTDALSNAARRWVAGQLAWEDRLDVLRHDSGPTDGATDAVVADLVIPAPRVHPHEDPQQEAPAA
jgi:hypothetical protein